LASTAILPHCKEKRTLVNATDAPATKMKPICKAEAKWKYWRDEGRFWRNHPGKFTAWAKTQMRKAKRRFLQHDLEQQQK
jgi:hypothetical protein